MDRKELELAKKQLREAIVTQNWIEIARIFGAPIDPRKPLAEVIGLVADIEAPASPEEYLFYFDVDEDVKYVYALAHDGTVTKVDVTVGTPSTVTFVGIQSPVYMIQIVDLNNAKFDVIGKKKKAVTRALDCEELYYVLQLLWAGTAEANQFDLDSGKTYFDFPKLLEMINSISDYGDNYVLITGSTVDNDIILTDYNENKNQSVLTMIDRLKVKVQKVTGTFTLDGESTAIMASDEAILVAVNSLAGKPVSFGRKNLNQGTVIDETQDAKERISTVVPAIPKNGEKPSVGVWGYGEFMAVLVNSKAVARFKRSELD